MLQIQRYAQLVAKPVERGDGNIVFMLPCKSSALGAEIRRIRAAGIAAADRVLDLDDLGSQACQQQRGKRAGQSGG